MGIQLPERAEMDGVTVGASELRQDGSYHHERTGTGGEFSQHDAERVVHMMSIVDREGHGSLDGDVPPVERPRKYGDRRLRPTVRQESHDRVDHHRCPFMIAHQSFDGSPQIGVGGMSDRSRNPTASATMGPRGSPSPSDTQRSS